ncbi:LysR family transcriptional regulator [Brevibacterium picturae]|uniref:LysR family transcriptional regulator n=1 Tax=Brevibacterium picturae TaxID=260553 RepID=A0ABP4MTI0_9MICO
MDTRLLRCFAAVAAEGNLTRAAEQLFVSQPAVTKQIKQLEALVRAPLFTRSHAGVTLTEAGCSLASRVPALLADWDRLIAETRTAAARGSRVLRVGYIASAANEATQDIIAAFSRRKPSWRVDMFQSSWSDPTAGLDTNIVDVALLRLPFPGQEAWRVELLFSEPRCVVLPSMHPFADREKIEFRDLWDEPFVSAPEETGRWRDYWLASDERHGNQPRIGAVTEHPEDWLNAIANGYGIALAPESAARFYQRPGLVFVPVVGVSKTQVGVVWNPRDDEDPAVQAFTQSCSEVVRR